MGAAALWRGTHLVTKPHTLSSGQPQHCPRHDLYHTAAVGFCITLFHKIVAFFHAGVNNASAVLGQVDPEASSAGSREAFDAQGMYKQN